MIGWKQAWNTGGKSKQIRTKRDKLVTFIHYFFYFWLFSVLIKPNLTLTGDKMNEQRIIVIFRLHELEATQPGTLTINKLLLIKIFDCTFVKKTSFDLFAPSCSFAELILLFSTAAKSYIMHPFVSQTATENLWILQPSVPTGVDVCLSWFHADCTSSQNTKYVITCSGTVSCCF